MSQKKRKALYWLFNSLATVVSAALPILAICEKYPIWTTSHGAIRSVGAGGILILIVILVICRKRVINFIKDKLKITHAPPLAIWIALLVTSYVLIYISVFLYDLTTVFWMGLIGCAIGTVLTFIAEHCYGDKKEESNG